MGATQPRTKSSANDPFFQQLFFHASDPHLLIDFQGQDDNLGSVDYDMCFPFWVELVIGVPHVLLAFARIVLWSTSLDPDITEDAGTGPRSSKNDGRSGRTGHACSDT